MVNHMVFKVNRMVQGQPWTQPPLFYLGSTHPFTIASSTSTIWFPRWLPYMVNHMVFKVNRMVQGQPWAQPPLFYLGAFANLRKVTINLVLSGCLFICLSVRMENSFHTDRIFIKFDV